MYTGMYVRIIGTHTYVRMYKCTHLCKDMSPTKNESNSSLQHTRFQVQLTIHLSQCTQLYIHTYVRMYTECTPLGSHGSTTSHPSDCKPLLRHTCSVALAVWWFLCLACSALSLPSSCVLSAMALSVDSSRCLRSRLALRSVSN